MPLPYRVTLQGFTAFERSTLVSYFRLAAERSPAYAQVDTIAAAHFLLVDADHAQAVRAARAAGRAADCVFIGGRAPAGAAAWLLRPIDPLHVLRELDAMAAGFSLSQPAALPALPAGDAAADGVPVMPAGAGRQRTDALLVDDSDIALRFLETRLQRWRVRTERASNSGKALEMLSRTPYDFIFLDVDLGQASDMDGLTLCHHIKRQHRHAGGGEEPVVVMVSVFHSQLDRARGALAGADAYLGKPLNETALARLLVRHGVSPDAG